MQKILICADLEGHFDFLIERLKAFISKGEHFDLVLCVGKTLSHTFDMRKFTHSDKPVMPIPFYFIDSGEFSSVLMTLYPDGKEIAPNLHYLGRSGIKIINGLSIAFLSGMVNTKFPEIEDHSDYCGPYYTHNDVTDIYSRLKKIPGGDIGIDILLTSEWPSGFDLELEHHHRPPKATNLSSLVADLAKHLRPRYHFVGLEHVWYQRPPYLNSKDSHLTRLTALGKMPKDSLYAAKEQYLYGIKIAPIAEMPKEELLVQTTDMTLNPYKTSKLDLKRQPSKPKEQLTDIQLEEEEKATEGKPSKPELLTENISLHFYGFDFRTSDIDIIDFLTRWGEVESYYLLYDQKKKHKGSGFIKYKSIKATQQALNDSGKFSLHGRKVNFKPANKEGTSGKSVAECWFCLSNENADRELIVHMGADVYIALDKGPITPRHVLIIPIDHYSSSLHLPLKARDEILSIKTKLVKMFDIEYDEAIVCYERFVRMAEKVAHLHIQLIPFKKNKLKKGLEFLSTALKGSGYEFYEMDPKDKLSEAVAEDEYYFYLEVLSADALEKKGTIYEKRYLHPMNEKEERQFNKELGRELVCTLLETPEKVTWRNCVLPEIERNRLAIEMRGKLKKALNE